MSRALLGLVLVAFAASVAGGVTSEAALGGSIPGDPTVLPMLDTAFVLEMRDYQFRCTYISQCFPWF